MTVKQQTAYTIIQTIYQPMQKDAFVTRWRNYKYLSLGANWTILTRKKPDPLSSTHSQ